MNLNLVKKKKKVTSWKKFWLSSQLIWKFKEKKTYWMCVNGLTVVSCEMRIEVYELKEEESKIVKAWKKFRLAEENLSFILLEGFMTILSIRWKKK